MLHSLVHNYTSKLLVRQDIIDVSTDANFCVDFGAVKRNMAYTNVAALLQLVDLSQKHPQFFQTHTHFDQETNLVK